MVTNMRRTQSWVWAQKTKIQFLLLTTLKAKTSIFLVLIELFWEMLPIETSTMKSLKNMILMKDTEDLIGTKEMMWSV